MRELAAAGAPIRVPVAVACRVLKLHRQHYYAWLAQPVTGGELKEAYLANAVFDAHREDPEFGYRLLFDEVNAAGNKVSERTVWKICSANQWWCVFGKKRRGKNGRPGAPAHDDLVRREFTAPGPNRLWLTDITEHPTGEGKVYLCAVKDVWSNRIVGYSIADRMTSQLAVDALESAVSRRGVRVAGCTLHWTAAASFEAESCSSPSGATRCADPWARSDQPVTTPPWRASSACFSATSWTGRDRPAERSCGSRS